MPSTYSNSGLELMADGEKSGTWGQITNENWELIEELTTGGVSIALSSTTYTLTTTDGSTSEGRHALVEFTGTPGGTCTVTIAPNDLQKIYWIINSSDQTVTLTQGSGGNVSVEAGAKKVVYCDGAGSGAAVLDLFKDVSIDLDVLKIAGVTVTSTAAELNILDGVTATAAELNYNDITTLGTVQASKTVTANASGHVNWPDNKKAVFGDGGDMELLHDGSNSLIKDVGTGGIKVQSNEVTLGSTGGENYVVGTENADVKLYYDNATKLTTTLYGVQFNGTGAVYVPAGTTAQQPGTPAAGYLRFNSSTVQFEGYNGTTWGGIGGAQAGGAIVTNKDTATVSYTIASGENGFSVGPVTVNSGVTITVSSGQRWLVQ